MKGALGSSQLTPKNSRNKVRCCYQQSHSPYVPSQSCIDMLCGLVLSSSNSLYRSLRTSGSTHYNNNFQGRTWYNILQHIQGGSWWFDLRRMLCVLSVGCGKDQSHSWLPRRHDAQGYTSDAFTVNSAPGLHQHNASTGLLQVSA